MHVALHQIEIGGQFRNTHGLGAGGQPLEQMQTLDQCLSHKIPQRAMPRADAQCPDSGFYKMESSPTLARQSPMQRSPVPPPCRRA
ncbi:hypothetical protein NB2BOR_A38380 [Bordetella parapertussis]|nr:hypothetical protein NB2BOR_A38380 [Bordetella parapertussis]